MNQGNLFDDVPIELAEERFDALASGTGAHIERIVSTGQTTPPGQWYDQNRAEWVVLLQGAAHLLFEGDTAPVELAPGDWVEIPAHCRHRIVWTPPDRTSVWLAVHYDSTHL